MARRHLLAWGHTLWQIVFFVLPTLHLIQASFREYRMGQPSTKLTLVNYIFLFKDSPFGRALAESLLLSGLSGILVTAAGTVVVLSAWEILGEKGRRVLLLGCAVMFFVGMVPRTLALGFVLSSVGDLAAGRDETVGILYSTAGLVFAYTVLFLPLSMVLLFVARSTIPTDFLDAAYDLGASWFNTQRRIVLPLLLPGLTVSALLVSILTIGDVMVIDLIGGGDAYTASTQIVDHFKVNDWGKASAAASLMVIMGSVYLAVVGALLGGRVRFDR